MGLGVLTGGVHGSGGRMEAWGVVSDYWRETADLIKHIGVSKMGVITEM